MTSYWPSELKGEFEEKYKQKKLEKLWLAAIVIIGTLTIAYLAIHFAVWSSGYYDQMPVNFS